MSEVLLFLCRGGKKMGRSWRRTAGGGVFGSCKRFSGRGTRTKSGQNKELRPNSSSFGGSSHVTKQSTTVRRAVDIIVTGRERAMWGDRSEESGEKREKRRSTRNIFSQHSEERRCDGQHQPNRTKQKNMPFNRSTTRVTS